MILTISGQGEEPTKMEVQFMPKDGALFLIRVEGEESVGIHLSRQDAMRLSMVISSILYQEKEESSE